MNEGVVFSPRPYSHFDGYAILFKSRRLILHFDDLVAKRFDVVISAVTIAPERQKQVAFAPYFNAGESLLVQTGNPKHITGTDDLCGLAVGVEEGTVEQVSCRVPATIA